MTMYLEHFGLREAPFRITPHTEFFFSGANRGTTLEALLYAITAGEGMVKVTGEVGSGKTMLCRVLMERLPANVETIYLAVPSLTRDEMLAAIAIDLGIDTSGANTTRLVRALQEKLIEVHMAGRRVVALIDEAHAMPLATLEEIRLLSNLETEKDKLLQIVLFGQPELDAHLALPNMRQLKERITHSFMLSPLPSREIGDYVSFRLRAAGYHGPDLFGPDALRIIADASEGLTRRINIYADKTLLAAFAAGTHTVSADHARAAVTDTQIVLRRPDAPRRMATVAIGGVAIGVALGYVVAHLASNAPSAPAVAASAMPAPESPAPAQSQAPAATTPSATPPARSEPTPGTAAAMTVPVSATATIAASRATDRSPAEALARSLAAGRTVLEPQAGARHTVQLLVSDARSRTFLEQYLAEAGHAVEGDKLFVVPSGSPEAPRLGVIYGAWDDRAQAMAALAALPEALRQFKPYVRPLESVREEARRAERR